MEVDKPQESTRVEEVVHPLPVEVAAEKDVENPGSQTRDVDVGASPAAEKEFDFAPEARVHPTEGGEMIPTEKVTPNFAETRREEVVIVTDDEETTEKEPQREPTRQEVGGHEESPARSMTGNAVGASVYRRRLLVDEEPEDEEDDVIFHPIGEPQIQRHPGKKDLLIYKKRQPDAPVRAIAEDSDRERREGKRKGMEISKSAKKKKTKQPSIAVVIQERNPDEGRQDRKEESEGNEALRWERITKRKNDGTRSTPEQRPETARVQIRKTLIRLDHRPLYGPIQRSQAR